MAQQLLTTTGLVIRSQMQQNSDRIVTIFSKDAGIIKAYAKKAANPKSKLFSGTNDLCYGEFTLYIGKGMYVINEASPIEVFFGLSRKIENMALAYYFCGLLTVLQPHISQVPELLRLLLNILYFLSKDLHTVFFVKPIYELRLMSLCGYMPNLICCDRCGLYEGLPFYMDFEYGGFLCSECAKEKHIRYNLNVTLVATLRHIVYSDFDKIFNFTLSPDNLYKLNKIAEEYTLTQLNQSVSSLGFYKEVVPSFYKREARKPNEI